MMRFRSILGAILLSLVISFPLVGGSINYGDMSISMINPQRINNERVAEMLSWIADNSNYPVTDNNMDLRFANQVFLQKLWTDLGGDPSNKIGALTILYENRHIITYLPINFDWGNHRHLTYLVHELVHIQQYIYNIDLTHPCKDFIEFEAYTMAITWFTEQGFDDDVFFYSRMKEIKAVDTCS